MEHTRTKNVTIIDEAFYMPQLGRSRRIWLYLPADYYKTAKEYPVIYMHDGQNLFDAAAAFGGEEWQVDETMNSLKARCIIVGIDNGGDKRLTEYNFFETQKFGRGEGKQYIEFIIDTLKPYIDTNFRTLPDRQNTFTAGSSMGGLISFLAALYYPQVFGGAGVFSPSFWLVPDLKKHVEQQLRHATIKQNYFFYAGGNEGAGMVEQVQTIAGVLKKSAGFSVHININPEGDHSEASWRAQMPEFYTWLRKLVVLRNDVKSYGKT